MHIHAPAEPHHTWLRSVQRSSENTLHINWVSPTTIISYAFEKPKVGELFSFISVRWINVDARNNVFDARIGGDFSLPFH